MRTVILDNYDSFTFNLFQYVGELDEAPMVFRNQEIDWRRLRALAPDRILISPGPGRPDDPAYFGVCLDAIRILGADIPILGVCLGHQGIFHAFGGRVIGAPRVMHGMTSTISHDGDPMFAGVPEKFEAMRYHSLVGDPETIPDCLRVTAECDGVIMAVRHRELPIYGVQFHPESVGTPHGKQILSNFLRQTGNAHATGRRSYPHPTTV